MDSNKPLRVMHSLEHMRDCVHSDSEADRVITAVDNLLLEVRALLNGVDQVGSLMVVQPHDVANLRIAFNEAGGAA